MKCINKYGCKISWCCFYCKLKLECDMPKKCKNNPVKIEGKKSVCNSVKIVEIKPLMTDEERRIRQLEAMKKYGKNKEKRDSYAG